MTWALQEAQLRDARLRLITAYGIPLLGYTTMAVAYQEAFNTIREIASNTVRDARAKVLDQGVEVSGATVEGDAAGALIKASEAAGLLVVGSRGLGGFAGRILGSVSSALPGHAQCAVVVIPSAEAKGKQTNRERGTSLAFSGVVAGIDGSDYAAAAALTAAEYAQRRGLGLTVIWSRPPVPSYIPWRLADAEMNELQAYVENEAEWLKGHFPDLDITARFYDRLPVETLADATATADLVVLGNRGHGGFAGLMMGSTSQSVVHHLRGPVMIVPTDKKAPDPRLENRTSSMPTLADHR